MNFHDEDSEYDDYFAEYEELDEYDHREQIEAQREIKGRCGKCNERRELCECEREEE